MFLGSAGTALGASFFGGPMFGRGVGGTSVETGTCLPVFLAAGGGACLVSGGGGGGPSSLFSSLAFLAGSLHLFGAGSSFAKTGWGAAFCLASCWFFPAWLSFFSLDLDFFSFFFAAAIQKQTLRCNYRQCSQESRLKRRGCRQVSLLLLQDFLKKSHLWLAFGDRLWMASTANSDTSSS